MPEVLYRKYRPQKFSELVNQEAVKITLQNAVASNRVAHAYLFTGPRGIGKTTVARLLAKSLNCLKQKNGEPCDHCHNCAAIRQGHFIDLIEIDAASHTGVDNIREIIEHVKFSPALGKYKVIVIDEVHMLSKGAFAALLKTLEEPPAHAVFVLATTELAKVPATIVSRTQRFDFKRLSQADIIGQLQKIALENELTVSEEIFKLLARAAEGGMRDALSLFDQVLAFAGEKITLEQVEDILGLTPFTLNQDFLSLLIEKKQEKSLQFVKNLALAGRDLVQFVNQFLEYSEMVLSFKISGDKQKDFGLTKEDQQKLFDHAQALSERAIVRLIEIFLTASQKVKYSSIPELPLELAAIEFIQELSQVQKPQDPSAGLKQSSVVTKAKPDARKNPENPSLLAQVSKDWGSFLTKLREYNHSLISTLKLAVAIEGDENFLTLAFPYRFHKEIVDQIKNRLVIEKALQEVYGREIKIKTVLKQEAVNENLSRKIKAEEKGDLMNEALKVFGS